MIRLVKGLFWVALVTVLVFSIASFWGMRQYDVSLRFLLERSLAAAGILNAKTEALLEPPHRYLDQPQDGVIRGAHPRILLPELASWDGIGISPLMSERLALYQEEGLRLSDYPSCGRKHVMSRVVCWLTTGDENEARKAVNLLLQQNLTSPGLEYSRGDAWEWALAFDLLAKFPELSVFEKEIIADKLRTQLKAYLRILDNESASLWHGRSTFAAQAWLLAVSLHGQQEADTKLAFRARAHFLQTIRALALTEAWPEGYNYWINNRALLIGLAASAWVNGLEQSELAPSVVQAIRRTGLWTVYATRPDNRIEALGDEGPRIDLKDETRRAIDVVTQLTRDSVFATYSAYLQKLHSRASYYSGFRWSFALFNDPRVSRLPGVPAGDLAGLENYLSRVEVFGQFALNLFIARSGWGPEDTFVSLRAGHIFTHHGHYGAGHFTLFKGRPLVVDSARYNGFFSPHRLYYGVRTVAKNSILVVRPGDLIRPQAGFEKNVNDGGQRLVMPTGSRIRDVDHWRAQLGTGSHYEGGELQEYDVRVGSFAYIRVDLTSAYDSSRYDSAGKNGKVSSVRRELVYLFKEDRLVVRDMVTSLDPRYEKKWLLHSVNRPIVDQPKMLLGNNEAGVFDSGADSAVVVNSPGRLDIKRILPEAASLRVIGGERYEFYVEADGAGSVGGNFSEGGNDRDWFDNGAWRLEIRPRDQREQDEFLVALSPSLGIDRSGEVLPLNLLTGHASGLNTPDKALIFTDGGRLAEMSLRLDPSQQSLMLVGVVAGDSYRLTVGDEFEDHRVLRSGIIEISLPQAARQGETLTLKQNTNDN